MLENLRRRAKARTIARDKVKESKVDIATGAMNLDTTDSTAKPKSGANSVKRRHITPKLVSKIDQEVSPEEGIGKDRETEHKLLEIEVEERKGGPRPESCMT